MKNKHSHHGRHSPVRKTEPLPVFFWGPDIDKNVHSLLQSEGLANYNELFQRENMDRNLNAARLGSTVHQVLSEEFAICVSRLPVLDFFCAFVTISDPMKMDIGEAIAEHLQGSLITTAQMLLEGSGEIKEALRAHSEQCH